MTPAVAALAIVFAPLTYAGVSHGTDVRPNESNNSVVLRGKVVKDSKAGEHPFHRTHHSNTPPKSPCTYSGLFVVCRKPNPARAIGTVFTPGVARSAVENIPMPGLALHVQPQGPTLVNVDTIFWTDPAPFTTSIDLLGHEIRVEATPNTFTWVHGDGSSQTTSSAGAPYPARDIAHRYMRPSDVRARVDTTYEVRFSIDGGGWDDLGQALTASGPATPIHVREAAPILVR